MTKLSRKPISSEKLGHYINNLLSAFTLMDSKEEVKLLFRSLFTHTEYKMFAKRLEIARRLLNNNTYESITKDLSVSEKTISYISNILVEKGEGFIKAHQKLSEIDRKLLNKSKDRQDHLERRVRKKLPGEVVLPELLKAGIVNLNKNITRVIKNRSARKTLKL